MKIKPGVYQHCRGNKYRVIGVEEQNETLSEI